MRSRYSVIGLLILTMLLYGAIVPVEAALAEATPIIAMSGKLENGEIVVDVILRDNEGISAMTLSLEYDTQRLVLTGFDRGEALSELDLMTTNTDGEQGYGVYPFKFNWMGETNDAGNGRLLTLRFVPRENADGSAFVTFTYKRNSDVIDVDLKTRNLIVDTLHVDLSNGEATEIENELDMELSTEPAKKNSSVIVGVSLAGVTLIALGVGLPLLWRKKMHL